MNISKIIFLCVLATITTPENLPATGRYGRQLNAGEKASGLCARCATWWHKHTHKNTVLVGDQTMPRTHLEQLINSLRAIELDRGNQVRFVAISHLAHTRKMVDETTGNLEKEIRDFLNELQTTLGITCFRRKTFRERMVHALPFVIQKKNDPSARRTLVDLIGRMDCDIESYTTLSIEQVLGEDPLAGINLK